MILRKRRLVVYSLFFGTIFILILFTIQIAFPSSKPRSVHSVDTERLQRLLEIPRKKLQKSGVHHGKNTTTAKKSYHVEIWGKAAIGNYLWIHVFNGSLTRKIDNRGAISSGIKKVGRTEFHYMTGPGLTPGNVIKSTTANVILVINGRVPVKVEFAKTWLEYLPQVKKLQNVAIVMLGNEKCENGWLHYYVTNERYKIRLVHLVYDDSIVDQKEFFQWPLGVATYRGFPRLNPFLVDISSPRRYICNFLGTTYKNSSRTKMESVILANSLHACYIYFRRSWLPMENKNSSSLYRNVLRQSDLTLCPIGFNSETYRIYEACSYGSVPVIEDIMTTGSCDNDPHNSPLRLLKKSEAPFIYVKDWSELPGIIQKEKNMSLRDKIKRRKYLLDWYKDFKISLRNRYVRIINEKFFNVQE